MTEQGENSTVIKKTINEINGLAFGSSQKWTEKDKGFFEERYSTILSLFPKIKKNDIGLEMGLCGGIMAFTLKRVFSLKKIYTLEHPIVCRLFTKKYLEKLEENKIILEPCDLQVDKLPWANDFFDFVIFSEVMEHLIPTTIPAILQEIKRVLKKRGWLFITTPNIASLIKRVNLILGKNPVELDLMLHEKATYGHIREYTMEELIIILQNQDYKIVKKDYFMIDTKRNLFTQFESLGAKFLPFLANNLAILTRKS